MQKNKDVKVNRRLEFFKASSTFISSVIIAGTGIFVTNLYNNRQLEISQRQAESELALTRLKEISTLVPKLGSADQSERKFSAIALGLYGKDAIPALVTLLGDDDVQVRVASITSLELIGRDAIIHLEKLIADRRNTANIRGSALYALGQMRAESAFEIAKQALSDEREDPIVRKDAATAMSFLKDPRALDPLLIALQKYRNNDPVLSRNVVSALGNIRDVKALPALVELLSHQDEALRVDCIWALASIGGREARDAISSSRALGGEQQATAVRDALAWLRRSQPEAGIVLK